MNRCDWRLTHLKRPEGASQPLHVAFEHWLVPSWLDGMIQRRSIELGASEETMFLILFILGLLGDTEQKPQHIGQCGMRLDRILRKRRGCYVYAHDNARASLCQVDATKLVPR